MRRTRWLLLAAILAIVFWVSAAYVRNKASFEANAPAAPEALNPLFDAQSQTWHYFKLDKATGLPVWKLRAKEARELKNPPVTELEGVELELYNKEADEYHLVKSAKAQFDGNAKTLYSDGDVDITMNMPVEGAPHGRMVKIHSSGVTFRRRNRESANGPPGRLSSSIRAAARRMGADYDPQNARVAYAQPGFARLARQDAGIRADAHRSRRGVLPGARIQGDSAAVVEDDARHADTWKAA